MDRTPYLTVAEAAAILRVHRQVVYRMVHAGDLAYVRAGPKAIRIPQTAIDALLQQDGGNGTKPKKAKK